MSYYYNGGVRHNNEKLNISLFDLFAVMYFLNKLLPVFGYYLPGIVFLGLFAYLMFFSFCRISALGKDGSMSKMLLLLCIALLTCVRHIIGGRTSAIPMYMYGEMQVILYGLIVLSYQCKAREQKLEKLFVFVIANYVITGVTTILGCIQFPMAARVLATLDSTDPLYALYTRNNIGGFTFVYELTLLTPLIIYMVKKKRINRVLGVAIIIMTAIVIINTEYTTALIFYIISLFTLFVGKLSPKKTVGLFGLFAAVSVFSSNYLAALFLKLANSVGNEVFSQRFEYIAYMLTGEGGKNVTEHGDRMSLYMKSLNSFLESRGFGTWSNSEVGGHSFILDNIGIYGFLGVIAIVVIYVTIFQLCLKPYKNKDFYGYIVWSYLVAIIFAVLNPKTFFFHFIVTVTLFASVMSKDTGEKKQ